MTGLATLYFVDVLDEYIPRLDDDMLNSFRSFVQEEASSCGTVPVVRRVSALNRRFDDVICHSDDRGPDSIRRGRRRGRRRN